jgi:16S rRNA (cytosine967-C5)-methyltransferase
MVKVKGILVYSTCTLNKKENERQIQSFLKNHPQFRMIEEVTSYPFENGGDGFYMAKCLRIE